MSPRMLVLCQLECCSAKSNFNTTPVTYLPPQNAIHSSMSSSKGMHKPFSMSLLSTVLLHANVKDYVESTHLLDPRNRSQTVATRSSDGAMYFDIQSVHSLSA